MGEERRTSEPASAEEEEASESGPSLLLTVVALSGACVAEVEARASELVRAVKLRLERATKTPSRWQDLLFGSKVLRDATALVDQGIDSSTTLTFVRKKVGNYPFDDLMRHICGAPLAPVPSSVLPWNLHMMEVSKRRGELFQLWEGGGGGGDLSVLVDFLLDCKVDPNLRDWTNLTPLEFAAREGLVEIVETLLEKPAFKSDGKRLGRALHQSLNAWRRGASAGAAGVDHLTISAALAQLPETDVNLKDDDGDTALMIALRKGALQVWQAILRRDGVDVGAQNRSGQTAFHEAVLSASAEACRLLLAKPGGAEAALVRDRRHRTPRDVAEYQSSPDVCDALPSAAAGPAGAAAAAAASTDGAQPAAQMRRLGGFQPSVVPGPPSICYGYPQTEQGRLMAEIQAAQAQAWAARALPWPQVPGYPVDFQPFSDGQYAAHAYSQAM